MAIIKVDTRRFSLFPDTHSTSWGKSCAALSPAPEYYVGAQFVAIQIVRLTILGGDLSDGIAELAAKILREWVAEGCKVAMLNGRLMLGRQLRPQTRLIAYKELAQQDAGHQTKLG